MQLKNALLLSLIILSSPFCYSQLKNFGVKGGLNVCFTTNSVEGSTKKIGYHFGIGSNLRMNDFWTLQPELLFSDQGFNKNDARYNLQYVNLPLLFKYQYKEFFFDFGAQTGLLINASKIETNNGSKKTDITGEFSNLDLSLVSGIGFMASGNIGIEGRFIAGMSNASNKENSAIYNGTLQISISYVLNNRPL